MNKNILEDIHIIKKHEEVKITPPVVEVSMPIEPTYTPPVNNIERRIPARPYTKNRNSSVHNIIMWIGLFVFLSGGIFWGITIFTHAKVFIQSRHTPFSFNNEQFNADIGNINGVGFEIMIVSDNTNRDVVFDESSSLSAKAQGTVSIYNNYSTQAQKLAIHTKLIDDNGLVYLTDGAVTIPGYKTSNKKIIPGSVSVSISAIASGENYNGDPRDFYITLFKGSAKYEKIYVRSKTPLTGGSSGTVYTLSAEKKGELSAFGQSTFKATLLNKLKAQVPPGYVLYPDALVFSNTVDENKKSKTVSGQVSVSGEIKSLIFKKDTLSASIINHVSKDVTNSEIKEIEVSGMETLAFHFTNPNQTIDKELKQVSFYLSGNGELLWHPDILGLPVSLSGILKTEVPPFLKKDNGISDVQISSWPKFIKHMPYKASKIKIILQ
jgi:hypothetical protein